MKSFLFKAVIACAFVGLTFAQSNADLVTATGAFASNNQGQRAATNLINALSNMGDGTIVLATGADPDLPGSYTQDATGQNNFGNGVGWTARTSGDTTNVVDNEWVIIDLGVDVEIDSINIFNHITPSTANNRTNRGVNSASIFYANAATGAGTNTNGNGTAFNNTGFTSLTGVNLPRLNDTMVGSTTHFASAAATNVSFGGAIARFIAVDINSTHGSSFAGLGEIQVFSVQQVPEPSSLAVLGLCGMGLVCRRKRRK